METIMDLMRREGWETVKGMPIREQVAEIDRRCERVLQWAVEQGAYPSKAFVRVALGISEDTRAAWADGVNSDGKAYVDSARDEDKAIYRERSGALKKWDDVYAGTILQMIASQRNQAAGIFALKSIYQYREQEPQGAQVQLALSIEGLLADVQAARLRQIEPQIIDVSPIQQPPSD